ncbi:metal ABC transporter solute-binding protein, Zn/Mn family [Alkalicoccus halolimnae]|uniref:Zinc ABC transporter substrate-binding protein n=1 Tax=Alkalicoccus halolimnae TaxID=1667239 RepID=A0A5C7F8X7_9BACI|nr:zinc ABC transporter substrate-binding protein [Alkalicoccus halolimnae]TXF86483.1 metal ABC transporter substrate-binding protein [Alkalicoccus halolimnae]
MKKTNLFWPLPLLLVAACGEESSSTESENPNNSTNEEGIYVTASFSIIGDMAEAVVGDRGTVDYIVPIGEEPHEYEPVPSNFQEVNDADVFYVNGMNLEAWLERIVDNAADTEIVQVTEGMEEIPLEQEDGPDPHAWLSPKNAEVYIDNIVADLSERDPEGAETFEENGRAYLEEIDTLVVEIEEMLADIPEEQRLIVVSENAFKYFGRDFNMDTDGIWDINSHEEGTTGQINRIIDVLNDRDIPAVFVESTVDKRYMETVADNASLEIAGEVYTDAVGVEGSEASSYIDMMRYNAETFAEGLSE